MYVIIANVHVNNAKLFEIEVFLISIFSLIHPGLSLAADSQG